MDYIVGIFIGICLMFFGTLIVNHFVWRDYGKSRDSK